MKDFYNYDITRKIIIQFCDCFNDIKIARYDKDGVKTKELNVPLKFAPKSKEWMWLERRDPATGRRIRDKILPIMSVVLTSIEYNNERKTSRFSRITSSRGATKSTSFYNPEPFTYNFEVKIATEYIYDMTQILEQILPYFTPTNVIRITIPELNVDSDTATNEQGAASLELKVILDSSSQETSVDIEESNYRAVLWTLQFKVDGCLLRNARTDGHVLKISNKIYTTDEAWGYYADMSTELGSGQGHQTVELLTEAISATKYDPQGHVLQKTTIYEKP